MGLKRFKGQGAGVGLGFGFGVGVGIGFGPVLPFGVGCGAGVGLYAGWGLMAGVGAEYISASSEFLEAKTHQQKNPFKLVQAQFRKVFKQPQQKPHEHPVTPA